jgi:hypothetical protein
MTTPTTDIAAWTAAVHDRAERVTSAMDHQTDLFGMFIDEMRGMREAVDHLSTSTASLSRVAASMVADEEEDEEVDEEAVGKVVGEDAEEEQEGDIAVDAMMGEVGEESGGDEEENKGGDEEENEGGEGNDDDDEDEDGKVRDQQSGVGLGTRGIHEPAGRRLATCATGCGMAARPASSMEAVEGQGERQNVMGKVKYLDIKMTKTQQFCLR